MNRTQPGRLITLDGPGGVGKSTTAALLAGLLREQGEPVHTTTEPSTRALGAFTRSHADHISGHALACLVAADRYDHLEHEVLPRLTAGDTVVCDRYLASSLVVQRLDDVPEPFLLALNAHIRLPDLAVILTADPAVILRRLTARGAHHRFERDPGVPAREVELYADAARTLSSMGAPVLVVDTGEVTPSDVAARIAASTSAGESSLTNPAPPRSRRRAPAPPPHPETE